ncbi:MAG: hypothetical protein RIR26_665, partial [Pseudomonadota bacterium]
MRRLLWEILFFRLLQENKKLFVMAALTVSLGVALALGIRLGTQSAIHSLSLNESASKDGMWSDALLAHSPEGKTFLRNVALSRNALVFSTFESKLVSDFGNEQQTKNIQLQILWSRPNLAEKWTEQERNSKNSGETGDPNDTLEIFVPKSCLSELKPYSHLQAQGWSPRVRFVAIEKPIEGKCQLLTTTPDQITSDEAQSFLQSLPIGVTFPTRSTEEKQSFESLKQLAAQIPGIELDVTRRRLDRLSDVTLSFRTNLQLMGFIALFIGFAMVHHIFSLLMAKQAKTLSTLSALGVSTQRQVTILLSVSACLGVMASTLGTALGLVAGHFLSQVTSDTVKNLYDALVNAQLFQWQFEDVAYGFLLGFLACFLGSLQPILRLQSLPVAQIMRDGSFESHDAGLSLRSSVYLTAAITAVSLA